MDARVRRRECIFAVTAAGLTTWALALFGVEPAGAAGIGLALGSLLKGA